jgi:hypothetical protein
MSYIDANKKANKLVMSFLISSFLFLVFIPREFQHSCELSFSSKEHSRLHFIFRAEWQDCVLPPMAILLLLTGTAILGGPTQDQSLIFIFFSSQNSCLYIGRASRSICTRPEIFFTLVLKLFARDPNL